MSDGEKHPIEDVRDAIKLAKDYVQSVLVDEKPINLGLEETEYDSSERAWKITVGFSRSWNIPNRLADRVFQQAGGLDPASVRRTYKIVTINGEGEVLSMKNRHE